MQYDIETEVSNFVEENNPISVKDNNDLMKASACIKGIKSMIEKVKSSFDPIVDQAHKAHKEAIGQRDKYLKPLVELEKRFKDAILVFNRKLEQENHERVRIANERMAKEAEEKKKMLLEKSQNTNDAWEKEELQEKAQAIVPITCDAPTKAIDQEGLSIRKTWKAKIVDINIVPKAWLIIEPNMLTLNKHAREHREIPIPGVEFYEDSSVSSR